MSDVSELSRVAALLAGEDETRFFLSFYPLTSDEEPLDTIEFATEEAAIVAAERAAATRKLAVAYRKIVDSAGAKRVSIIKTFGTA